MKLTLSFIGLCLFSFVLNAQTVWIQPKNASTDDTVTVFFQANSGNRALENHTEEVYLHTGVITDKSLDGHDWKHVVGNWGTDDERVLMNRGVDPNQYSFRMHIRSFYQIRPEEVVHQLAFVFRDEGGTLVGKTTDNEDVLVPINGYIPPDVSKPEYLFDDNKLIRAELEENILYLKTEQATVRIRPMTDYAVEVVFFPDHQMLIDSSDAVILNPEAIEIELMEGPNQYMITSGQLNIIAQKNPFRLIYLMDGDTLLQEEKGFFERTDNNGIRFYLQEGEHIYGTGERSVPMNRRGYRLPLYNRPYYGYETDATMLNYSVPMTLSSNRSAILFDNPQKGYVDIGETEKDIMEFGAVGGLMKYYFMARSSFPELMQTYTNLTGRQPLPARWMFGNLQSRMGYRSRAELDSIVDLTIKYGFPLDAMIIDLYWFGDSLQGTMGRLEWYQPNWPEPEEMISKLRDKGVKTVLITEPYILDSIDNFTAAAGQGLLATDSLGAPYINYQFYFGNGGLIDIFKPEAQEWFWQFYEKQNQIGVAGWWGDLGEPESHPPDQYHINGSADEVHNVYAHYWHKMLFEKYQELYPNTRLFNLNRAGYAGSQRYAVFPWTGDVARSWGGYQAQPSILLNMSLNGLGYIHSDAGGFAQGKWDEELYTRWLQFACFTPILRPHGSGIPSEPVYFNDTTRNIVRDFMKLRYRLLPYIYTAAYQNAVNGKPLMRPLFYHHPYDTLTWNNSREYFFGDNLLVAPVWKPGQNKRSIYLPEGKWLDFWEHREYSGGQTIDKPVDIETIPIFIKEGSFIPMVGDMQSTDAYDPSYYEVWHYPTVFSSFEQYEDDGWDNLALQTGNYELIKYVGNYLKGGGYRIRMESEGQWQGKPDKREIVMKVFWKEPYDEVFINGKDFRDFTGRDTRYEGDWLILPFSWSGEALEIIIRYK